MVSYTVCYVASLFSDKLKGSMQHGKFITHEALEVIQYADSCYFSYFVSLSVTQTVGFYEHFHHFLKYFFVLPCS